MLQQFSEEISHQAKRSDHRPTQTLSFTFNPIDSPPKVQVKHVLNTKRKELQISVPAKLSKSLTELVAEYDKAPNRASLAYTSHVNAHRKKKKPFAKPDDADRCTKSYYNSPPPPSHMIQLDLSQPLSRDKIMDLIKFAMIEHYPTNGYIVDGVFLDQGDGVCFNKLFYSPAVCTYFTESAVNTLIDEWNRLKNARPPAQDVVTDKEIKSKVQLVLPKNLRRNKKYSFVEIDRLCRLFETKLIRVLNAEEANQETINFVYSLVYKHIRSYPSPTSQQDNSDENEPAMNFFSHLDECDVDDDASNDFLSPVNSPLNTQRDPRTSPSDPVEVESKKIVGRKLPVIWILGCTQLSTQHVRQTFCHMLSTEMNFTYINLDEEIAKWYDDSRENKTNIFPSGSSSSHPLVLQRAKELSKRIVEQNDILTGEEIIELVKLAMILETSSTTSGYVIDGLPVNDGEASLFEQLVYPSTSLIYFLNLSWTSNKSQEPLVQVPKYYRRLTAYSEHEVERVCDSNGYKAIKIWNAEDLDEEGMRAIRNIIQECINSTDEHSSQKIRAGDTTGDHDRHPPTCYNATPWRKPDLLQPVPLSSSLPGRGAAGPHSVSRKSDTKRKKSASQDARRASPCSAELEAKAEGHLPNLTDNDDRQSFLQQSTCSLQEPETTLMLQMRHDRTEEMSLNSNSVSFVHRSQSLTGECCPSDAVAALLPLDKGDEKCEGVLEKVKSRVAMKESAYECPGLRGSGDNIPNQDSKITEGGVARGERHAVGDGFE